MTTVLPAILVSVQRGNSLLTTYQNQHVRYLTFPSSVSVSLIYNRFCEVEGVSGRLTGTHFGVQIITSGASALPESCGWGCFGTRSGGTGSFDVACGSVLEPGGAKSLCVSHGGVLEAARSVLQTTSRAMRSFNSHGRRIGRELKFAKQVLKRCQGQVYSGNKIPSSGVECVL